mmetsp:Transcript_34331/g.42317  ORF Transcript_34331/g.42317 Transcript_34331/m.42317 type:complete len:224 (-) Transcript_34331:1338-2009(-)
MRIVGGLKVTMKQDKYAWLLVTSVHAYSLHNAKKGNWAINPVQNNIDPRSNVISSGSENTQGVNDRAKECGLWVGDSIIRLTDMRNTLVTEVRRAGEFDQFRLAYIQAVKLTYKNSPLVVKQFFALLEKFNNSPTASELFQLMKGVASMFIGRDGFILGFENFLPPGFSMILLLVQQKTIASALIGTDPELKKKEGMLHERVREAFNSEIERSLGMHMYPQFP